MHASADNQLRPQHTRCRLEQLAQPRHHLVLRRLCSRLLCRLVGRALHVAVVQLQRIQPAVARRQAPQRPQPRLQPRLQLVKLVSWQAGLQLRQQPTQLTLHGQHHLVRALLLGPQVGRQLPAVLDATQPVLYVITHHASMKRPQLHSVSVSVRISCVR
jgi:hypothetical protein